MTATAQQEPNVTTAPVDPFDSRCHFRFANGKRCRSLASQPDSRLCYHHLRLTRSRQIESSHSDSEDLSSDLLHEISELSSAEQVYTFLTRLLTLVTKGRISPRRASVLGYITNQLLNSQRTIIFEEKNKPGRIIIDMPGPDRSGPEPQPAPRTWQEMRT